jgi:hypothetical protein
VVWAWASGLAAAAHSFSAASLRTYARCSAPQRLARERGVVLHRQNDDLGVRRFAAQLRDRLERRSSRHVQLEHQRGRLMSAQMAPCRMEVSRLPYDLEVLFAVEQQPQTTTHHLVIVGGHEPHPALGPRR